MAEEAVKLFIKKLDGQMFQATITRDTTVGDLSAQAGDDVAMIFNGKLLAPTVRLFDLGVQRATTLHAVPRPAGMPAPVKDSPVEKVANAFYGYCPYKDCRSIFPIRLRPACKTCGSEGFIMDEGGICNGYEDIKKKPFFGQCQKCNGHKQAQFLFRCCGPKHPNDGEVAEKDRIFPVPLPCVINAQLNRGAPAAGGAGGAGAAGAGAGIPCLSCLGDDAEALIRFPCNCMVCFDCSKQHLTLEVGQKKLFESPYGYTVSCPNHKDSLIDHVNGKLFRFAHEDVYNQFQRFATVKMIEEMPGGYVCPFANCNEMWMQDYPNLTARTRCPKCREEFCKECNTYWHEGPCDPALRQAQQTEEHLPVNEEAVRRQQQIAASEEAMRLESKPCPSCKAPIFKDGGCMHVTCKCGYEFCWIDGKKWGMGCQNAHWFG